MVSDNFEQDFCQKYLDKSKDEMSFEQWIGENPVPVSLILAEGFEERSLGILTKASEMAIKVETLVIGRYKNDTNLNRKYRAKFEMLAEKVCPANWKITNNNNDGIWVAEAMKLVKSEDVVVDITALSNRGLFGTLDSALLPDRNVYIAYNEAKEYWPKKTDWEEVKSKFSVSGNISEIVDTMPWLFSYEHSVELINGYEGYDSAGSEKALVAFLPFKSARLAAIMERDEYSKFLFIIGHPRLEENSWRSEAQIIINERLINNWLKAEMNTFGYRNSLRCLSKLLFDEYSILQKYNVHLAILGSKLQTIGCWIFCNIVRSITCVTGIPLRYFPDAFSEGIGASWIFRLESPKKL